MGHLARINTDIRSSRSSKATAVRNAAKQRAAVHEAGTWAVYAGLRRPQVISAGMLSTRHLIATLLAGYVAERLHGFELALDDERIREEGQRYLEEDPYATDIGRAYWIALNSLGSAKRFIPAGRRKTADTMAQAEERRHARALRLVRQMWKKTEDYLSLPELREVVAKVAKLARRTGGLTLGDDLRLLRAVPAFDAETARGVDRVRERIRTVSERRAKRAAAEARYLRRFAKLIEPRPTPANDQ